MPEFNPDEYLSSRETTPTQTPNVSLDEIQRQQFNPNNYLAEKGIESYDKLQSQYGGLGQQAITGVESAAAAGTFGLSTGIETRLGLATPEEIRGRQEANPISSGVGQVAGLVGSAFLPG